MKIIEATEARDTLGSLLDEVEGGEEFLFKRNDVEIARLIPVRRTYTEAETRAADARIRQRAKEYGFGPFDWEEWKAMRDEGRR